MTVRVMEGHVLDVLGSLPSNTFQCAATSPPYYGLRDYGLPPQVWGGEPSVTGHEHEWGGEIRAPWANSVPGPSNNHSWDPTVTAGRGGLRRTAARHGDLKPKDLMGMPWMVAFALRADGWYLRSEIIWSKPNPMPESVTDRPTKAHETVFLLAKSRTYFYDADAIREEVKSESIERARYSGADGTKWNAERGRNGIKDRACLEFGPNNNPAGRNKRSVWEIATAPFPSAHFATFPPKLVEPMLLAGTSEKGCCPECGKPWERVTSTEYVKSPVHGPGSVVGRHYETGANGWDGSGVPRLNKEVTTTGWRPTCAHDAAPAPCQVLDPFGGAGTTGLVADRLGRDCTLIELNPEYAQMARERIEQDAPLFADVA